MSENSLTANGHVDGEEAQLLVPHNPTETTKPITFFRAWFLPGVLMVSQS